MEITLIRTGGIIPMQKKATIEVSLSETELDAIMDSIKAEGDSRMRDNTQYQLEYKGKIFSIDLEKVPKKYKKTFDSLKDNLQIIKPD